MNRNMRITRSELTDLGGMIHAANSNLSAFEARALGLYVRLTLTRLHHNLSRELLRKAYGMSLIAPILNDQVPAMEDMDPTVKLRVL
mgnify:CR=1 FL=1